MCDSGCEGSGLRHMNSPCSEQNTAVLIKPTTRPLSQYIMSPLYCLLRGLDDDNFKVQVLLMGGGGEFSVSCVRKPGLGLGPPHTCILMGAVEESRASQDPLPGALSESL